MIIYIYTLYMFVCRIYTNEYIYAYIYRERDTLLLLGCGGGGEN